MTETVFVFLATFGALLFGLALAGFVVDVARAAWSVARTLIRSRREWRSGLRSADMPAGRISPCGRRDCRSPHPYRPWVERDPRGREPW